MRHAFAVGRTEECAPHTTADRSRRSEVASRLRAGRHVLAAQQRALSEQRGIGRSLRRTILPEPDGRTDLNGMRVAVRYHAADEAAGVGGDWYVSDPLPCGCLLLAVGDVAGHGLAAAGTMVQLRHATAALAVAGYGPGDILTALNHLLCRQATGAMATAVVATYRPVDRELTWARAGHPPILRANRDGAEPLWQPAGAILGALPDAGYPHAAGRLAADDLLVMYTDGYVEEPGRHVDDGLQQLGDDACLALRGQSTDRPTAVVDRLRRRNPRDDACVLAAAPTGQTGGQPAGGSAGQTGGEPAGDQDDVADAEFTGG